MHNKARLFSIYRYPISPTETIGGDGGPVDRWVWSVIMSSVGERTLGGRFKFDGSRFEFEWGRIIDWWWIVRFAWGRFNVYMVI